MWVGRSRADRSTANASALCRYRLPEVSPGKFRRVILPRAPACRAHNARARLGRDHRPKPHGCAAGLGSPVRSER